MTRDHRLNVRQVRLDAMETSLKQFDQSRTLNGEEPVVPLPAEKFAANSAVNQLIYLRVDVRPCALSSKCTTITSCCLKARSDRARRRASTRVN